MPAASLVPLAFFLALFAALWRVSDLGHNLPTSPDSSDPLEFLWLIDRWFDALRGGSLPFWIPGIWHPVGVLIGSLGNTPASYAIGVAIRAVSNATFAYNVSMIVGLALAYAAAYRLIRAFAGVFAASLGAAAYAFSPFMVERILNGHLNIVWGAALLVLMASEMLNLASAADDRARTTAAVKGGILWGILILFQLYGVWWGGLMWFCAHIAAVSRARRWQGLLSPALGIALGAPALALYAASSARAQLVTDGIEGLVGWGASLNSLLAPSMFHPVAAIHDLARTLYTGILNESGTGNLGWVLPLLGIAGAIAARDREGRRVVAWLAPLGLLGFGLSLGMAVKWNGHPIQAPFLEGLDQILWNAGRAVKPQLFLTPSPPGALAQAVPAPGWLLAIALPGWESARVSARFALVVGLALSALSALVVDRVRPLGRLALATLILFETWPPATGNHPTPTTVHPADAWVAAHREAGADWSVLDLSDEPATAPITLGGRPTYAGALAGLPIASGFSSFMVRHFAELLNHIGLDEAWLTDKRTPSFLRQLRIGYVLIHRVVGGNNRVWDAVRGSPYLVAEGCYKGDPSTDVWRWEICVARARWLDETIPPVDIIPDYAWSSEAWGAWSLGTRSEAGWISRDTVDHVLRIDAFTPCLPDARQALTVTVNAVTVATMRWDACEARSMAITVPAALVKLGWNDVAFTTALPMPIPNDGRVVGAGFTRVTFSPAP